jgi:hypothetical protein
MTFVQYYVLMIGLFIMGWWTFSLLKKQVPELTTEPIRISFHLVAEFVTAIILVVGGIALLTDMAWGIKVTLISLGMLLYTVIVSPGYFVQSRQWPMVGIFIVILVLTTVSIFLLI